MRTRTRKAPGTIIQCKTTRPSLYAIKVNSEWYNPYEVVSKPGRDTVSTLAGLILTPIKGRLVYNLDTEEDELEGEIVSEEEQTQHFLSRTRRSPPKASQLTRGRRPSLSRRPARSSPGRPTPSKQRPRKRAEFDQSGPDRPKRARIGGGVKFEPLDFDEDDEETGESQKELESLSVDELVRPVRPKRATRGRPKKAAPRKKPVKEPS